MKKYLVLVAFSCSLLLVACSSNSESSKSADYDVNVEDSGLNTSSMESASDQAAVGSSGEESSQTSDKASQVNRKIIYTSSLTIEVKNYQQALNQIETQIAGRGGYIVESNMHGGKGDEMTSGYITLRIPQDQFHSFIKLMEDGSYKVLESSVSGQDVTEEYIDLESRLKSKRVVEKRLLSFMEKEEKTEDLLKISDDLATVQEEIEQITGRMKYLKNRVDLATITIHIQENHVSLSTLDEDDLNTWERTKQQFLKSINMLVSFLSGLIVFIVGNLPVLLLLAIIGFVIYWSIRKSKRE